MRHLKAINQKAARIEQYVEAQQEAIAAAGDGRRRAAARRPPQQPAGRTSRSAARWSSRPAGKSDRTGGTAGLCQPVERDLFDCHIGCYWPAQVPDQLNHAPDWTTKCAAAQKDWRKIDLVFP